MSVQQMIAFGIVGGAVACFAWGRFCYDVVALSALLAGLATGIVHPKEAFTGFTSEVVVIIACALIVSRAGCDVLTPVGRRCNTLVLRRGGTNSGITGSSDCRLPYW